MAIKYTKQSGSVLPPLRQIRAVYDDETIRVYQAFSHNIADTAMKAQRFVSPPFSMTRMTWIKPSFLWMMYRSGWGTKDELQLRILAIDITRAGFEWALANRCESQYSPTSGLTIDEWRIKIKKSCVRLQWDPERDLNSHPLDYRSLQIGLRNEAVYRYVHEWIVRINDITDLVRTIRNQHISGDQQLEDLIPQEKPYEYSENLQKE